MSLVLPNEFYKKDTKKIALDLLECDMVREINKKIFSFQVKEVEIYEGFRDRASHAFRGKTKRNELMFKEGGVFYIYLIYGMHFMLNVVTQKKDYPAAILIRKIENYDGPGKITKNLNINKSLNGARIEKSSGLWFEKKQRKCKIKKLPRIGIDYAGEPWKSKPLRFKREN